MTKITIVIAPDNSQNFRCWRLGDTSGINSANNVGLPYRLIALRLAKQA